jgi:hypothetical protein
MGDRCGSRGLKESKVKQNDKRKTHSPQAKNTALVLSSRNMQPRRETSGLIAGAAHTLTGLGGWPTMSRKGATQQSS